MKTTWEKLRNIGKSENSNILKQFFFCYNTNNKLNNKIIGNNTKNRGRSNCKIV